MQFVPVTCFKTSTERKEKEKRRRKGLLCCYFIEGKNIPYVVLWSATYEQSNFFLTFLSSFTSASGRYGFVVVFVVVVVVVVNLKQELLQAISDLNFNI